MGVALSIQGAIKTRCNEFQQECTGVGATKAKAAMVRRLIVSVSESVIVAIASRELTSSHPRSLL